jgi:acetyl esterase/lipase
VPITRLLAACLWGVSAVAIVAQSSVSDPVRWSESVSQNYLVYPDQVYGLQSGVQLKLDVWQVQTTFPVPTVIYYHGGGWFFGDRTGAVPYFMPWIARGWNVINVEYRMSGTAPAPAAVQDARCALRWVYRNAKQFHLDSSRIIVTGHSAGGHLALMAGMLQDSDGLDTNCPADASVGDLPMKVAAVIDWYGIADVTDVLQGPNEQTYAVAWLGSQPDKEAQANRVSPIHYVRAGLPPIFMVHGDQDPTVPYSESVHLHQLLDAAHQPNQLYTIPGGKHGMFGKDADEQAYEQIWEFLEHDVPSLPTRGHDPLDGAGASVAR